MTTLRIGSLFSGYAGLDIAAERVFGAEPAWFVEYDDAPSKILAHHYPNVPNYGDVTTVDWTTVPPIDILTGGSPCQDLSSAGKRAGMTDGTRSNLWVNMREAIAATRPRFVVWENVLGALSAAAASASDMEPDDGPLGNWGEGHLRALGRVLGDLAEVGYDSWWTTIRASDVGAPHHRERVFVLAELADSDSFGRGQGAGQSVAGTQELAATLGGLGTLPERGRTDAAAVVLPTPRSSRGASATETMYAFGAVRDDSNRPQGEVLLPTPAACNPNDGEGVETWEARRRELAAKYGNNGMGTPLSIAVQQMLPTPNASDDTGGGQHPSKRQGHSRQLVDYVLEIPTLTKDNHARRAEERSPEILRRVRAADVPQEVQRQVGGSEPIPVAQDLFPELRQQSRVGSSGQSSVASAADHASEGVCRVQHNEESARAPQGQESGKQLDREPGRPVRELPSEAPLAGGSRLPGTAYSGVAWGKYEPAIRRWEAVSGRPAPAPTEPNRNGRQRLNAEFASWMMGLPAGWVTDVPGLSRAEQLKAIGNGVCPPQSVAAIHELLELRRCTMQQGVA